MDRLFIMFHFQANFLLTVFLSLYFATNFPSAVFEDQVLRVLDYSRISRHLLVTAGDDGTVHLWDTTGRSPKVFFNMLNYIIILNAC